MELALAVQPASDVDFAQLFRDDNLWTAWTEANARFFPVSGRSGKSDGDRQLAALAANPSVVHEIAAGDRGTIPCVAKDSSSSRTR